jgi:serine/threonine protein phosphatase 1
MNDQRTIIIGDIHGCLDMLKKLMDKVDAQPGTDRIIFLGDYIDRGDDPKGVVDYILSLRKTANGSHVECLIGNHEALFLNFMEGKDRRLFFINGGWSTLESYQMESWDQWEDLVPPEHVQFYRALTHYVELEDHYVVHAGFRPGIPIPSQTREDMVWIRDPFIFSSYDFGKKVVFGHTPFYEPLQMENKIGLDTGAVYNNRLTCLILPEGRFVHVEA